MASPKAVTEAVRAVYTAANVPFGPAEFTLYRKVLADVTDSELLGDSWRPDTDADLSGAVRRLVVGEQWGFGRRPSPALVLEWVATERAARRARAGSPPAVPDLTPRDQVPQRMADVRAARAEALRISLPQSKEQA